MVRQRGFTVIEVMVVLAVILVLAGLIVPVFLKHLQDARVARARHDVKAIATAVAAQLTDTGTRPTGAVAGGARASAQELWASNRGALPRIVPVGGHPPFRPMAPPPGANNLTTLLSWGACPAVNPLFGFPPHHRPNPDLPSYRGPYLTADQTINQDPWGRKYFILGYNRQSKQADGPIWVVCAGKEGLIHEANLRVVHNRYPENWEFNHGTGDNIVVKVR
jgi:prepilin-type N-terminal cleavage/methylation domain-containing protein